MPTHCAVSQPQLSLPRCRASEASTFRTSDREIPNSRAIRGGAIPALKAARTAFTWPRVSERTATCAGRTLEERSSRCWIVQCTCCQTRRQRAASLGLVERCLKKRREFTVIQLLERVGQILRQQIPAQRNG